MASQMLRSLSPVVLVLLAACGGIPRKTFTIDAIDVNEQNAVPCLVVVGEDWTSAAEKNQLVNLGKDDSLSLTLVFDRPEIEITVAAVAVNPDTGKPVRMPRSRTDSADYIAEPRRLQATDPTLQLFILQKK
jgi:hypothetical protein